MKLGLLPELNPELVVHCSVIAISAPNLLIFAYSNDEILYSDALRINPLRLKLTIAIISSNDGTVAVV